MTYKPVSPTVLRLLKAQGSCCYLCGRKMVLGKQPTSALAVTLDHVTPRALGGKSSGNLLLSHRRCNQAKGHRRPTGCELVRLAEVNARLGDTRYMPGDGSWIDDRPAKARPKALEEWITL